MRTLLVCSLLAAAAPARAEIIDGVAAVVNGDIVLLSEVEEHAGASLPPRTATGDLKAKRETILHRAAEDLILDKLVAKECKEQNLEPTVPEIDNAIEDVQRANHIDKPTLEKALGEQGLTMPRYREMLTTQLCRMKVVEVKVKNRVTVTDDDVKNFMANKNSPGHVAATQELKLRDIYVPSEGNVQAARAAIADARARLQKGEDFALVAHETTGPLMKTGGDLGWIKMSDLAPELQKAAASVADGHFSEIIESPKGFHVLKVEERRDASDTQSKAQAREEVRQQLQQEKMVKATEDYLAELRRGAEIQLRLP